MVDAPAPEPFAGTCTQTGSDRVLEHVAAELLVVTVVLDDLRRVAARPQWPEAIPAPVEGLGIDAVQVLHAACEIRLRRFDDEVVMRRHEAVGVETPAEPSRDALQQIVEPASIELVTDDRASCDSARPRVVVGVRALDSVCSRHRSDGSRYVVALSPGVTTWHRPARVCR